MVNTQGKFPNNIVCIEPTVIIYSNAFKYGMGGHNIEGVELWWNLQPHSHRNITLNILKFLLSIISIYIMIDQLGKYHHIKSIQTKKTVVDAQSIFCPT